MMAYQLLGGNRNNPVLVPERVQSQYNPGSRINMFSYKGPRRAKVMGVWDEKTLNASMPIEDFGLDVLRGAHIVVGTTKHLRAVAERRHLDLSNARYVVIDEADECMQDADALDKILAATAGAGAEKEGNRRRQVRVFAGASLSDEQVEDLRQRRLLSAAAAIVGEESASSAAAAAGLKVPPALTHRYVVAERWQWLGVLARLIRAEILRFQEAADAAGPGRAGVARPRFIIYAPDAESAMATAGPLQNALWTGLGGDIDSGLWGLSVLLPSAEDGEGPAGADNATRLAYESSLRVMEMFQYNQTNVLVTTPLATRGLDFSEVSHVYNLGLVGTPADYLHRAGRCGRIGQATAGLVVSVLDTAAVPVLQSLGRQLGFTPAEAPVEDLGAAGVGDESPEEDKVRFLEDIFQLYTAPAPPPDDA